MSEDAREIREPTFREDHHTSLYSKYRYEIKQELDDPYKQMQLEAYRSKWNELLSKLVRRIGKNVTEEEFLSSLRVSVADSMREAIKSGKDSMTGLPNKVSLERGIDRMMKAADRTGSSLTVLYIDLDHFKTKVNDTHGHDAGDTLIKAFGSILKDSVRETDIAGRFSGDEFGLGLIDTDIAVVMQKIQDGLIGNYDILGISDIAVSIGVSTYLGDKNRRTSELKGTDLIHQADLAMSHAKGVGDKLVKSVFFREGMKMQPHTSR